MSLFGGHFVVFEGLDGSGTSTQARMLQEALSREFPKVFLTSEPTTGPVGNLIRLAMSHRLHFADDPRTEDHQLAYLFAADRYDHLHNEVDGILKQLRSGSLVISTRYYLSSFAYHSQSDADFELIERLNRGFPPADITFFVDCPVDTCLRRIEQRQYVSEKYEHRAKLVAVRERYEQALQGYGHRLHRVDGEQAPDALHSQILQLVRDAICPTK